MALIRTREYADRLSMNRPSRPRRLLRLCLFLPLGLTATWAVAWGSAMLWKPVSDGGPSYIESSPPYRVVTMDKRPGAIASQVMIWGSKSAMESCLRDPESRVPVRDLPGVVRTGAYPPQGIERRTRGLTVEARGWPCYALYCKLDPYYPFGRATESTFGAIIASDADKSLYDATLLPYLPYWPGLITNTLFYALLFGGVHQLTGWGQRFRRRRRGECFGCGYDLIGINGVCPECGGPP